MSSPYKDLLLHAMKQVLDAQHEINWFINKELSVIIPKSESLYFSFFDDGRTFDLPFQAHPGFLCIRTNKEKIFRDTFQELLNQYAEDTKALSNLYVIYQGISADNKFLELLLKDFKDIAGIECIKVFDALCSSLNGKYFLHHHLSGKNPESIKDWIDIFRAAQGFSSNSDPVVNILRLVRDDRNRKIAYKWMRMLKPLLRAPLIGWYGFQLEDTEKDLLETITNNKCEATFVAASLIKDSGEVVPAWLTTEIVEIFINQYWEDAGKTLLVHVFGMSHGNNPESTLFKSLHFMLSEVLEKSITDEELKHNFWSEEWQFPDTFIAVTNWLSTTKRNTLGKLPEHRRGLVTQKMIDALQKFIDDIPTHLSKDNYTDVFNSYQLLDQKYLNSLGFLLLYLLEAPDETEKRLKSMFFKVRPLYFGGYEATNLAVKFTEFNLVLYLSIVNLHDLDEQMIAKWKRLLNSLCDTLLVPFLHLAERNNEVWDKGKKLEPQGYHAGLYLINKRLGDIIDGPYSDHLGDFMTFFNSVKVAEWPFERRIPQKPIVKVGKPQDFTDPEKEVFVALLKKQDKVRSPTLLKVNACLLLGVVYINDVIVSIGAVKPKTTYDFDEQHANLPELSKQFNWELGYCFTEELHTRRGYSRIVVENLLSHCAGENLLATTVVSEENSMIRILEREGFERQGAVWNSVIDKENQLALFLRYSGKEGDK